MAEAGDKLWQPSEARCEATELAGFSRWLGERGKPFADYESLWAWSADSIEDFWEAVWAYFNVDAIASRGYERVLTDRRMPGAEWFPGARLNFARAALMPGRDDDVAVHAVGETSPLRRVTRAELRQAVFTLASELRARGVQPGDRVASYLPNVPEALIAFLATASIGAVWSSCSPDFGADSVVDRFAQIAPRVLLYTDSYTYGGKDFDRRDSVRALIDALPSLELVVHVPGPIGEPAGPGSLAWDALFEGGPVASEDFDYADTAFGDPLWIVYSSGTTGPPKPFVHGHGGATLEGLKQARLHFNLSPGSSLFVFTTTGWIMWNLLVYGLLAGSSILMMDGNPMAPEPDSLWRHAAAAGATALGLSPAFVAQQMKLGATPNRDHDLARVEALLMSGSPVSPAQMAWCYENINRDLWLASISGGTDIASAFVGGVPTLPVYAGEIQARCLGVDVHALNDNGEPVIGEVGELVVRKPMPSMPLYFWGDDDGSRYRDAYFNDYPGLWRHGDFFKVNERGGCFILGRSDSTLNRHGIRIGTAEIYRVVDEMEALRDSVIVNLDLPDGGSFMPLFVVLPEGESLDDALRGRINQALRSKYSPRHVPDRIIQATAIPYTLTGKKMEVPLRKILLGAAPQAVASPDAMGNPEALDFYLEYRETQSDYPLNRIT